MVNPNGKDVINDPGSVKHILGGAGILDSSVTDENIGGLDDRGTEFNFLSLHINTMTTMSMLGLTAIAQPQTQPQLPLSLANIQLFGGAL